MWKHGTASRAGVLPYAAVTTYADIRVVHLLWEKLQGLVIAHVRYVSTSLLESVTVHGLFCVMEPHLTMLHQESLPCFASYDCVHG